MARWGLYGCQGANLLGTGNLDELLEYYIPSGFTLSFRMEGKDMTFVGSIWDGNKSVMFTIKKMKSE